MLGEEQLAPPPPECVGAACGRVGLLCLYTSVVAGLVASFAEGWLARRLVAARRARHEAAEEARAGAAQQQPLLAKGKAKQVRLVGFMQTRCWAPQGGVAWCSMSKHASD